VDFVFVPKIKFVAMIVDIYMEKNGRNNGVDIFLRIQIPKRPV